MDNKIKSCLIISGGEYNTVDAFSWDFVIACDKGFEYAERMKIKPDVWIGDFDSYKKEPSFDGQLIKLPIEKDDTDTISAIKYAIEKGCEFIHVCCAFGGRLDHTVANIQAASFAVDKGVRITMSGLNTVLYTVKNDSINLYCNADSYVSVFSLTDKSIGVTLKGLKYSLDNTTLTNSFPLGVSNECSFENKKPGEPSLVPVEVKEGILAVIVCKKD